MPISRRLRSALFVLLTIILIGAALLLGLRKSVSLSINDQSRQITTYAFKVGDLLHSLDIPLSAQDALSPAQDTWLKNGATVTIQRAIPVQVVSAGKINTFYSTERLPARILKQAGISLSTGDKLLSNGLPVDPVQPFPSEIQSISLQILPAVRFSLTADGKTQSLTSTSPTLGAALWSAGLRLFLSDQLIPSANTPLTPGLSATLTRSQPVTINSASGNLSLRTPAKTVAGALADAHLPLQGLDYSLPDPDQPIPASGVIKIVRVTEDVLIEQIPLPFETQYQPVDDLELDRQSIVQEGEYGLTATRVRVRYEDGQEVSRQVENEWTARQPVPRILGYGTLVTMQTEVVDGISIQYWRKLNMYATSYHPSEVGDTTASGLPLKKGVAAIDRSIIPFYTQMYIPGYGEAIAADTGGGVIGRWIDLGYSDSDYVPWHQWVTVYFLWPPPATIVWTIP